MIFSRVTYWMIISAVFAIVAACGLGRSDHAESAENNTRSIQTFAISGSAQKGPFIKGTRIIVNRLSEDGEGTYETSLTEINDNFGNFSFNLDGAGPILIEADGIMFNEITGQLSQKPLRLRAFFNVEGSSTQRASINVLTHLAYQRIQALIKVSVPIKDAINQAEKEVIASLRPILPIEDLPAFSTLNLLDPDPDHAISSGYLIAASATFVQYALEKKKNNESSFESELIFLLDNLSFAIAEAGRIDSVDVLSNLREAAKLIRPEKIKKHLEARYFEGSNFMTSTAQMDQFLDIDGDGIVNQLDHDDDGDNIPDVADLTPYEFTRAPTLSKPANATSIASMTNIAFEWTSLDPIKEVKMQISTNKGFVENVSTLSATGNLISTRFELADEYFIRSRGKNTFDAWSVWGEPLPISVGRFEYTIGTSDFFSEKNENFIGLALTANGGVIVNTSSNTPSRLSSSELDSGGNLVTKQPSTEANPANANKTLSIGHPRVLMNPFNPTTGSIVFKLFDEIGTPLRDIEVSFGNFNSVSATNPVLIDKSIYFIFIGTICVKEVRIWFQCLPIEHPTLVYVNIDTNETVFTKLSGFDDVSSGSPTHSNGSRPHETYQRIHEVNFIEDSAPWGHMLDLKKMDGDHLLLTFTNRFQKNCRSSICYRLGRAKLDLKGNVAWTWLSAFLNNKPLHYFEVMTNIGLYVLESLEAYNGNINQTANIEKTNNLYLFDLQNRNSRVLKNFEVITESPPPVITRDGHLLALPSDARARRYLLKLDVTGNVVRVLSPPCKVGQLCKIVDFKPTLDGGLILTLEINDENYIRPQTKIVKWMNTDLGR